MVLVVTDREREGGRKGGKDEEREAGRERDLH